jgi:fructose-1,6-bisphosphatase I
MTSARILDTILRDTALYGGADASLIQLLLRLSDAGRDIAALVARGPLAGAMSEVTAEHRDGDLQKALDVAAHDIFLRALREGEVAAVASEEAEEAVILDPAAPYVVALDPVDGSTNIETNLTIGTIFAILPRNGLDPAAALLQPGRRQAAAGLLLYGPQTALVLTLGRGTQLYVLDPESRMFVQIASHLRVPRVTAEYAVNGSNARHWDPGIRAYVMDCVAGADGPLAKDFNTRWVAAVVADAYRILMRGGVYLYPGDARKGYTQGRLRLTYEANPIAFIMEQAGGMATDGRRPVLDIVPDSIHQRIPLVFGSAEEVERVRAYLETAHYEGGRSPLFSDRSLFRA